jgi:enamine deaminase RidA (YjgF/YER057c/UK114 family)
MFVYKIRPDGVYEYPVEVPDGTTKIPKGHTFSKPPEIPEGYYAVMMGGWKLVSGTVPVYPKQVPPPTAQEIQEQIVNATQKRLDDFAKTRNYDSILSACTYATSTVVKFSTEGQYCVEARDATWSKLYEILAEVQAETRPMPSGYSDIESELPVLQWPVM